MLHRIIRSLSLAIIGSCLAQAVAASQLVDGKLETKLVPGPVELHDSKALLIRRHTLKGMNYLDERKKSDLSRKKNDAAELV